MSKSWYSRINELELKDGSTKIEHHLVFETDSKEIMKKVESFFKSIMDGKEDWEDMKYGYIICGQKLNEEIDTMIDEVHSAYMRSTNENAKNRLDAQMKILWIVKSHIEDALIEINESCFSALNQGGRRTETRGLEAGGDE